MQGSTARDSSCARIWWRWRGSPLTRLWTPLPPCVPPECATRTSSRSCTAGSPSPCLLRDCLGDARTCATADTTGSAAITLCTAALQVLFIVKCMCVAVTCRFHPAGPAFAKTAAAAKTVKPPPSADPAEPCLPPPSPPPPRPSHPATSPAVAPLRPHRDASSSEGPCRTGVPPRDGGSGDVRGGNGPESPVHHEHHAAVGSSRELAAALPDRHASVCCHCSHPFVCLICQMSNPMTSAWSYGRAPIRCYPV